MNKALGLIMALAIIKPKIISGRSMYPLLNPTDDKDIVLFLSLPAKVGSIVLVTHPYDPSKQIVKRVDAIYDDYRLENTVLGKCAWLASNEPFHGEDSRSFGPVPMGLVHGVAVAIIWPLNRIAHSCDLWIS